MWACPDNVQRRDRLSSSLTGTRAYIVPYQRLLERVTALEEQSAALEEQSEAAALDRCARGRHSGRLYYSVMPRLRMQEARRCLRIRAWPRSYASNKHMQLNPTPWPRTSILESGGTGDQFTRSQNTIFVPLLFIFSKKSTKSSTSTVTRVPRSPKLPNLGRLYSGTLGQPETFTKGFKKNKPLKRTKNLRLRRIWPSAGQKSYFPQAGHAPAPQIQACAVQIWGF